MQTLDHGWCMSGMVQKFAKVQSQWNALRYKESVDVPGHCRHVPLVISLVMRASSVAESIFLREEEGHEVVEIVYRSAPITMSNSPLIMTVNCGFMYNC